MSYFENKIKLKNTHKHNQSALMEDFRNLRVFTFERLKFRGFGLWTGFKFNKVYKQSLIKKNNN